MKHEGCDESTDRNEDARKHILRAQRSPRESVAEDAREDRVPVSAQARTRQEGFPQSAHPLVEGAHVVAHVLAPREAETNEDTQDCALRRMGQQFTGGEDQDKNTDALRGLLHDGPRGNGSDKVNRIVTHAG